MPDPDVVDLPDEEAVRHFRAKRDRQDWDWSFDWRDVSAEEHLTQWTFAKAARLDVLQAVRAEVDRAIAEGRTLRQFTRDLAPRLQKLGWWGEKEMVDPRTGEARLVEIGPRRLATIFDTNIRMAHARGRWERIEALKERMPYLRYVATLDARTRPDHRRWHGTVLRVDDEWWRSHYPPNGWRCRCAVQQLSEDDLERRGWTPTGRPPSRDREWVNRRTGEVSRVPAGIDPGFERNAGSYAPVPAAQAFLDGKIAGAPGPIQDAAKAALLDDRIAVASAGRAFRKGVPPAELRAEYAARLKQEFGAGSATAPVQTASATANDLAAAELVRQASRMFPARLVQEAGPLFVEATPKGSKFRGDYTVLTAVARVDPDKIDNAIHEYVHHLQARVPGFQTIFRAEHIRRTTLPNGERKPIVTSSKYGAPVRDGGYIDAYFGAHYQAGATKGSDAGLPDAEGLEVPTRGYQILFHSVDGEEMLGELANDDPGLLDLLLGGLFRYP